MRKKIRYLVMMTMDILSPQSFVTRSVVAKRYEKL
jgi:hypothetical protein